MPSVERAFTPPTAPPRRSPADRPPLAVRALLALTGLGAILMATALFLSDRAPGVVERMFGDRVRRLWERVDASERVDLPPASELPSTDFFVHVGIWAVVAGLVGLALWTWRGLAVSALVLAGLSVLIELAQGRYATTRVVEARDAVANLIGIGLGLTTAALCLLVWSALAGVGRLLVGDSWRGRAGRPLPG